MKTRFLPFAVFVAALMGFFGCRTFAEKEGVAHVLAPVSAPAGPLRPGLPEEIELPGEVRGGLIPAGEGRFLVLHYPALERVDLLDMATREVLHRYPAEAPDTWCVAGRKHLLIVSAHTGNLRVVDLDAPEKIRQIWVEPFGHLRRMVMGADSEGPAHLFTSPTPTLNYMTLTHILDPGTLELSVTVERHRPEIRGDGVISAGRIHVGSKETYLISPSGDTLMGQTVWKQMYQWQEGQWWRGSTPDRLETPALPTDGGDFFYTPRGIFDRRRNAYLDESRGFILPALRAPYRFHVYLTERSQAIGPPKTFRTAALRIDSVRTPLRVFDVMDRARGGGLYAEKTLPNVEQFVFAPDADVFLYLRDDLKTLLVFPLELNHALANLPEPFLYLNSRPLVRASVGESWGYAPEIRGNHPPFQTTILAGPEGMRVTGAGEVQWTPGSRSPRQSAVVLALRDAVGTEVYQAFSLEVAGGNPHAVPYLRAVESPEGRTAPESNLPEGHGEEVDLVLPGRVEAIRIGGGGRFLVAWMPELPLLAFVDVERARVAATIAPEHDQVVFAIGAEDLILYDQKSNLFDRYDLETLLHVSRMESPLPVSFDALAMGGRSNGPLLAVSSRSPPFAHLLDPKSLRPISLEFLPSSGSYSDTRSLFPTGVGATAAEDGSLFGLGHGVVIETKAGEARRESFESSCTSPVLVSSHDGSVMKRNALYTAGHNSSIFSAARTARLIPSFGAPMFLAVDEAARAHALPGGPRTPLTGKLYFFGSHRPVWEIADLMNVDPLPVAHGISAVQPPIHEWIHLLPEQRRLITLRRARTALRIRRFDFEVFTPLIPLK
ncbi:MAG: hypothetical protein JJU29_21625 [Verrucomicrobia bacterium]|nr:hypothetical protein [Verrucomicrobiota bacterium]MCH8511085.1 hypothetical protein [Kiritimatiellia bacterium]